MKVGDEPLLNGFSRERLFELLEADFEAGHLTYKPRKLEDFKSERAFKIWTSRWAGKSCSSITTLGYVCLSIESVCLLAHRVLWFMRTGEVPVEIDHLNGNKADNRRENLRNVSHRDNLQNQRRRSTSTSGLRGVHYYKSRDKWTAQICIDGVHRHLGYFDTKEDAFQARLKAEESLDVRRIQDETTLLG